MSFADLINIENCIFEINCFSKKSFLVFNKNFKHCTENQILFFQTSWKDGLSKKIVMKYDLSCIIGKNDISFFRKYDLTLRRKMKDDLCQKKIHGNMIFSSNVQKRWSFQKRLLRWGMIFIVLSGKMVFFPENMIFLPWKESERQAFPRNTWKYEILCVHVPVLQTWRHAPLSKKIKHDFIPQKYTWRWLTF